MKTVSTTFFECVSYFREPRMKQTICVTHPAARDRSITSRTVCNKQPVGEEEEEGGLPSGGSFPSVYRSPAAKMQLANQSAGRKWSHFGGKTANQPPRTALNGSCWIIDLFLGQRHELNLNLNLNANAPKFAADLHGPGSHFWGQRSRQ